METHTFTPLGWIQKHINLFIQISKKRKLSNGKNCLWLSAKVHDIKITVKQGTYLHSCLCIVNHAADYGGSRFSPLTQTALCMCPDSTQQDAQQEDEDWLYVKNSNSIVPEADECLWAVQPIRLNKPSGWGQSTVGSMSNSFHLLNWQIIETFQSCCTVLFRKVKMQVIFLEAYLMEKQERDVKWFIYFLI